MDVGVEPLVVMAADIEDDLWLLRGCCVVEIDEGLSMNLMLEDWESRAHGTDIIAAH
jgi:hypothetical protein